MDFGIGLFTDRTVPERAGITATGFTETAGSITDRRGTHAIYDARLLRPWGEGSVVHLDGAPARTGEVTFNSARHGLERWEKPGAMGVTDVADDESATTTGRNRPGWVALDATESVRYFLVNPAKNHGWKISQDTVCGVEDSSAHDALRGLHIQIQ